MATKKTSKATNRFLCVVLSTDGGEARLPLQTESEAVAWAKGMLMGGHGQYHSAVVYPVGSDKPVAKVSRNLSVRYLAK